MQYSVRIPTNEVSVFLPESKQKSTVRLLSSFDKILHAVSPVCKAVDLVPIESKIVLSIMCPIVHKEGQVPDGKTKAYAHNN